jgi:hypothetical protein
MATTKRRITRQEKDNTGGLRALLMHQLVLVCWRAVPQTISFYNPEPSYLEMPRCGCTTAMLRHGSTECNHFGNVTTSLQRWDMAALNVTTLETWLHRYNAETWQHWVQPLWRRGCTATTLPGLHYYNSETWQHYYTLLLCCRIQAMTHCTHSFVWPIVAPCTSFAQIPIPIPSHTLSCH